MLIKESEVPTFNQIFHDKKYRGLKISIVGATVTLLSVSFIIFFGGFFFLTAIAGGVLFVSGLVMQSSSLKDKK
jgi:hypothetical protein